MTRVAKSVRITGRVQGVFFRQSASDEARRLGVAGWVRNCADGSVEAHVEGDENAVAMIIDWLHQGPPHAQVVEVQVQKAAFEGHARLVIWH